MALTQAEVLVLTRDLAARLNSEKISREIYERSLGEHGRAYLEHFKSLEECLRAAGLNCGDPQLWTDDELLRGLVKAFVLRKTACGYAHTFQPFLPYEISLLKSRFKTWYRAYGMACEYAHKHFPGYGIIKGLPQKRAEVVEENLGPETLPPSLTLGPVLNFRNLQHEPTCEQGVVLLFGMLCEELGYVIEAVRTRFPDCEAKRCIDRERQRFERVRIEFEYNSSNFKLHGHDENKCDVIVCWKDDWPEWKKGMVELSKVVKELREEKAVLKYKSGARRTMAMS